MGRVRELRSVCGMEELQAMRQLAKALLAEFIGTAFIVLVGCGSCTALANPKSFSSVVQIALAFGLVVATAVQCVGSVSGGHLNPAVTCALVVTGRCSFLRAFFYIIAQCVGAVAGAAVLRAVTPTGHRGALGITAVHSDLTAAQGCGVEAVITFMLVMTVFSITDENRIDNLSCSVPLAVGFSVTAGHCFAVKYTGSSMNTARSFGPAVITGVWNDHWVYWVGPILGGVAAGLIYQHLFASPAPEPEALERMKLQTLLRIRDKEIIVDRTTCI